MKNTKDINNLELKERAITAGMVVELMPDEADALCVDAYDVIDETTDEQYAKDMEESRFDPCEFDLDNYELEPT